MDHDQIDRALAAWHSGDVNPLAELLDPAVELLWWTPGDWDCHGKDQVLALLTERTSQQPRAQVDISELNPTTLLVERTDTVIDGPEAGFRPATVIRFRDGRVVHMQQYRSRDDALSGERS